MKIVNGWAFPDADQFMVEELNYQDGSYQRTHLEAALKRCKKFRTAIDGGAHIGTWSRIMSRSFKSVLAFEAASDTYDCLVWNMDNANCANVYPRYKALGDRPGRVRITLDGDEANQQRQNTGARHAAPGDEVDVITIDSLELGDLDFLKLDIEGSEPAALRGARGTLLRCKPVVLFEDKKLWTKHYGEPKDACVSILKELGMVHLERVGCDQIWGWK